MDKKSEYRKFCETELDIPFFSKDWWLDAVCGEDNWDVVVVSKGGNVMATMPYYLKKRIGFWTVKMPLVTQTMGPYIKYPKGQKYAKRLSFEKEVLNTVISELPKVGDFNQNFNHRVKNWLPFYWANYTQSTRYTYLLEDLSDLDEVFKNFSSNIKTDIKKAKNKVHLVESEEIKVFYEVLNKTFLRKKIKIPYSLAFIVNMDVHCKIKECRKILLAKDSKGNIHAGIYLVWDANYMYYLMGGGDPDYRNSGATSYLIWEAIKLAASKELMFDFEGSMMEPVEKFFRAFGTRQKPYFQISRTDSKLLKTISFLKNIFK